MLTSVTKFIDGKLRLTGSGGVVKVPLGGSYETQNRNHSGCNRQFCFDSWAGAGASRAGFLQLKGVGYGDGNGDGFSVTQPAFDRLSGCEGSERRGAKVAGRDDQPQPFDPRRVE